eukprot:7023106-Lingulodinium_polyedra.AAC.1
MRSHSQKFQELPPEAKRMYDSKAAELRASRSEALSAELEMAEAELALHAARAEEALASGSRRSMVLSECRWSPGDLVEVDRLYASDSFSRGSVARLRAEASVAPPAPSDAFMAALAAQPLWVEPSPPKPQWLSAVCHGREQLSNAVLIFSRGPEQLYYKFVYASQSPYAAFFCIVEPVPQFLQQVDVGPGSWESLALSSWEYMWQVDLKSLRSHAEVGWPGEMSIEILPNCVFLEG